MTHHEATKPKRKAASWGHAYRRFLRTGIDHADAAYRADERPTVDFEAMKRGDVP
jgi:hypothetical protein